MNDKATQSSPLTQKIEGLPSAPGVYLMRDQAGKVVYVGKAKSLKFRVRCYFQGSDERSQVPFLVGRVHDLDVLVTTNEKEALILENNLIKQYKPRYNIRLKDDKSYVSVKVTVQDPWPRILVTRKIVRDGSRYFGPFSSASAVRETMDLMEKTIPLRTCSDANFRNRSRPCIKYQIKRCLGPCVLPVDRAEYEGLLKQAMLMIEGKNLELITQLRQKMAQASEALRYEEAAKLRNHIQAIERTVEKQTALAHWGIDQDVFGLYREGGFIEAQVLFVRQGKLTGNQAYSFEDLEFSDEEVMEEILAQFYQGERQIPDEILVPVEMEEARARSEYLSERRGRRMEILYPQRGKKLQLLSMARENARHSFHERHDQEKKRERMMEELKARLPIKNFPARIECFDISNIQGTQAVGSMVIFQDGQPDKDQYRRYKIRTVEGADDFAMMYEVLKRRFERAKEENILPDLLIVDGGKGQLNVALEVMRELEIQNVDVIGLAKMRVRAGPREREIIRTEERVFVPYRSNPVVLNRNSNALFLLQQVRDEAHRFAITYHKKLRSRETIRSILDTIRGVGKVRRRRLLNHFGSVRGILEASEEELAKLPFMTPKLAHEILTSLNQTRQSAFNNQEERHPS
jgi:excinuclease ABC subunit C